MSDAVLPKGLGGDPTRKTRTYKINAEIEGLPRFGSVDIWMWGDVIWRFDTRCRRIIITKAEVEELETAGKLTLTHLDRKPVKKKKAAELKAAA